MIFYNKTTLLPGLDELYLLLIQGRVIKTDCFFCVGSRIAIEHTQKNKKHSIRIWETNSIFNYWYGRLTSPGSNFIAALDYTIDTDHECVKIDYMSLNDGEHGNIYKEYLYLSTITAQELNENLIGFIENVAKIHSVPKIVMDVHQNLRIYNKYYKNIGFELTDRRCRDNPYWLEMEKYV